jgi:hypothetical protein
LVYLGIRKSGRVFRYARLFRSQALYRVGQRGLYTPTDKGIRGAFAQVAQGYFEVVFQHKNRLMMVG